MSQKYCTTNILGLLSSVSLSGLQEISSWMTLSPATLQRKTQEKLQQLGIERLLQPPASPDLNPIVNIWQIIKQKFAKTRSSYYYNCTASGRCAKSVGGNKLLRLIETLPTRIKAVIASRGRAYQVVVTFPHSSMLLLVLYISFTSM